MRQLSSDIFVFFVTAVLAVAILVLTGCGGGGGGGTVGQVSAVSTPTPTPTQTQPPAPPVYSPNKGILYTRGGNVILALESASQNRAIVSETQLTSGGTDSCPTASTWVDKTTQVRIAFQRDSGGGNAEAYWMYANGSGLTNVSNNPAVDKQPIFYDPIVGSPQSVWFCSNREGSFEIYQADLNGGALTKQSAIVSAAPVSWLSASRAWTYFVFMSQRGDGIQRLYRGLNQGMVRLTEGEDNYPDVSPDGIRVAYTHTDPASGRWEVWVMALPYGGSGPTKIPGLPAGENWYPRWAPDGSELLFVNSSSKAIATATNAVYRVKVDGTGLTKIQDGVLYPDWIWWN